MRSDDAFSVESTNLGAGRSLVVVNGAISARAERVLEATAIESVLLGRHTVVLDLRGVTDLGGGLLASVLRMRRGLSGVRGDLALVVEGGPVQRLVQSSALRALLTVAPTTEQALEAVGPAAG